MMIHKGALLLLLIGMLWVNHGFSQNIYLGNDSLLVIQEGTASFYGKKFHKRKTASGEMYDMYDYTAAHKHLPFGTLLKITNLKNGYEVIVKINDRLPKYSKRAIDLSRGAAEQLDMVRDGLAEVKIFALSFHDIERLKNHYGQTPEELRLRVYHDPVKRMNGVDIFSPVAFSQETEALGLSAL
jgi:rare lipoprotein A